MVWYTEGRGRHVSPQCVIPSMKSPHCRFVLNNRLNHDVKWPFDTQKQFKDIEKYRPMSACAGLYFSQTYLVLFSKSTTHTFSHFEVSPSTESVSRDT